MKKLFPILFAALTLGLSACSDQSDNSSEPSAPAPAAKQETTEAPEVKPAEPAAETKPAAESAQTTAQDTKTVTNDACLAAVSKETGESNLTVLSNEFSEANTLVMIGVGASRAPWKCLVSSDGKVEETMFTGNDGDGAKEPAAPADASSSDVSRAAIDACLSAVKAETGEADLATLSAEFSEANSLVMVGVGTSRAPWKCLVSNDGQVAEVSSASDEGQL